MRGFFLQVLPVIIAVNDDGRFKTALCINGFYVIQVHELPGHKRIVSVFGKDDVSRDIDTGVIPIAVAVPKSKNVTKFRSRGH